MAAFGSKWVWIARHWRKAMIVSGAIGVIALSGVYSLRPRLVQARDEAVTGSIRRISYTGIRGMERADIYYIPPSEGVPIQAVLVLCPGDNANGELLIVKKEWREFARDNQLGLVGLSLASSKKALADDQGYYRVEQGSGRLVLEAIRKVYGNHVPLLVYGFSGGAHFTSNFINWAPQHVIAWCAYSAAWWDASSRDGAQLPAGIIACGDLDMQRVDESYSYFKKCRLNHQRVTWVCLARTGHELSPALNEFVRIYFKDVLEGSSLISGEWRDVEKLCPVDKAAADDLPILSAWLPSERSANYWLRLNSRE